MIFPAGKNDRIAGTAPADGKIKRVMKEPGIPGSFLHGRGIESGRFDMKMVCYKLAVLNRL
jgi:hypothetical protein